MKNTVKYGIFEDMSIQAEENLRNKFLYNEYAIFLEGIVFKSEDIKNREKTVSTLQISISALTDKEKS